MQILQLVYPPQPLAPTQRAAGQHTPSSPLDPSSACLLRRRRLAWPSGAAGRGGGPCAFRLRPRLVSLSCQGPGGCGGWAGRVARRGGVDRLPWLLVPRVVARVSLGLEYRAGVFVLVRGSHSVTVTRFPPPVINWCDISPAGKNASGTLKNKQTKRQKRQNTMHCFFPLFSSTLSSVCFFPSLCFICKQKIKWLLDVQFIVSK